RRRNAMTCPSESLHSRAAISENDQLAATTNALGNRGSGVANLLRLFLGHLRAQPGVVCNFHADRIGYLRRSVRGQRLLAAQKRIEKFGLAYIVPQFAM